MGTSSIRISQSQITNKIHQIQLHPQQQPPIIMSSNDNTSSLQSVMDTATGYINSGIAAVTGSAGDQAKADQYKTKGEAESDLSHTAAKAGPFTISSSGAPAKDNSQRTQGQLSDLGKGVSDRVQGAVGGAAAALTGDRAEQQRYADVHDEGKTRQRGVELDLDKQAAAQK